MRVRHWSLCRKYGYLIGQYPTFNRHRTANPYMPILMWTHRGAPNSMRWLACVSSNLCMQWPYYVIGLNSGSCISCVRTCTCMLRCNSKAILNWGPFGRWTPGHFRLPAEPAFCAFSNTFSVRSHINIRQWSPCRKPTDDERVALRGKSHFMFFSDWRA